MGWDPAPFTANLSLYSCEHLFQAKLWKQNYSAAKQNYNNCCYIDDINTLNNKVFEDQISLIYPQEIICNRENNSELRGRLLFMFLKPWLNCMLHVKNSFQPYKIFGCDRFCQAKLALTGFPPGLALFCMFIYCSVISIPAYTLMEPY